MQAQQTYVSRVAELFPPQGYWTEADYFALPETKRIVELWDGELIIMPAPSVVHQRIAHRLSGFLFVYSESVKTGEGFEAPTEVRLGQDRVRQPDVLFVKYGSRARLTESRIEGPPDWVAEIISPGSRTIDKKEKLQQYAEAGIPEYWLIDPKAGTVSVYVLGEGATAYTLSANYSAGETIRSAALEGFEVAVDDLLGG